MGRTCGEPDNEGHRNREHHQTPNTRFDVAALACTDVVAEDVGVPWLEAVHAVRLVGVACAVVCSACDNTQRSSEPTALPPCPGVSIPPTTLAHRAHVECLCARVRVRTNDPLNRPHHSHARQRGRVDASVHVAVVTLTPRRHGVAADPAELVVSDGHVPRVPGHEHAVAVEPRERVVLDGDALRALDEDGAPAVQTPVTFVVAVEPQRAIQYVQRMQR